MYLNDNHQKADDVVYVRLIFFVALDLIPLATGTT